MRARWSSPRRSYPQFRCGVGLLLGLLLFARPLSAAEITYVVKRQDTLTAIAQRHQTTASAIAQRNKLALRANIYPGQRLIIPVTAPLPKPVSAATLSRDLQTSIATAPVKSRRWRNIVIHHAAVDEGTCARSIAIIAKNATWRTAWPTTFSSAMATAWATA
jgi:LysM repeat protein